MRVAAEQGGQEGPWVRVWATQHLLSAAAGTLKLADQLVQPKWGTPGPARYWKMAGKDT